MVDITSPLITRSLVACIRFEQHKKMNTTQTYVCSSFCLSSRLLHDELDHKYCRISITKMPKLFDQLFMPSKFSQAKPINEMNIIFAKVFTIQRLLTMNVPPLIHRQTCRQPDARTHTRPQRKSQSRKLIKNSSENWCDEISGAEKSTGIRSVASHTTQYTHFTSI